MCQMPVPLGIMSSLPRVPPSTCEVFEELPRAVGFFSTCLSVPKVGQIWGGQGLGPSMLPVLSPWVA